MKAAITYMGLSLAISLIRCFPLRGVAWMGRIVGGWAFHLDRRHRMRAIENLTLVFGKEWSTDKIAAVAKENFRRLGENYASAIRMAFMSEAAKEACLTVTGTEHLARSAGQEAGNDIVAIGHFGNFEAYTRIAAAVNAPEGATTYRALKNKGANRVMETLRHREGMTYFERRKDAEALKNRLRRGGLLLGLLSDHYAGRGGVTCRFLGHPCSSSPASVVLAMRYKARLFTAVCYRVELARWRIDIGREIPLKKGKKLRPVSEVTQEVQEALGDAVRRDPANWFWVHHRWRTVKPAPKSGPGATVPDEAGAPVGSNVPLDIHRP